MRHQLRASLVALALGLSLTPVANADGPHRGAHSRHEMGLHPVTTISVDLNERARDEVIPLRRLLDIDRRYRGYRLGKVVVHLRPRQRSSRLSLLVDGQIVDSAAARDRHRVVLRPRSREIFGHTTGRLRLAVEGPLFIEGIDVQLWPSAVAARRHHRVHDRVHDRGDYQREQIRRIRSELVRILLAQARHAH